MRRNKLCWPRWQPFSGRRAGQVPGDIDSVRTLIRVEQGKDRYVTLLRAHSGSAHRRLAIEPPE